MPWFWNSFEEYKSHVNPIHRDGLGVFRYQTLSSWAEHEAERLNWQRQVRECLDSLDQMGFGPNSVALRSGEENPLHELLDRMVCAAENMLAFDHRLGVTKEVNDFSNDKDELLRNWDRYRGNPYRDRCISELFKSTSALIRVMDQRNQDDRDYLLKDLALPEELLSNFRNARDLFSVGFDDAGAFAAGRALEGVLRYILKHRRIQYKSKPAHEAGFFSIVEVMDSLRWKKGGESVLAKPERSLLHLLRELRNNAAHPGGTKAQTREVANLCAYSAGDLYHRVAVGRRPLQDKNLA